MGSTTNAGGEASEFCKKLSYRWPALKVVWDASKFQQSEQDDEEVDSVHASSFRPGDVTKVVIDPYMGAYIMMVMTLKRIFGMSWLAGLSAAFVTTMCSPGITRSMSPSVLSARSMVQRALLPDSWLVACGVDRLRSWRRGHCWICLRRLGSCPCHIWRSTAAAR